MSGSGNDTAVDVLVAGLLEGLLNRCMHGMDGRIYVTRSMNYDHQEKAYQAFMTKASFLGGTTRSTLL